MESIRKEIETVHSISMAMKDDVENFEEGFLGMHRSEKGVQRRATRERTFPGYSVRFLQLFPY